MAKNLQHTVVLKKTVSIIGKTYNSATITKLASELRKADLISQQVHDSAIGNCRDGPARILAAVQSRIKENPESFCVFLKSLRSSNLEDIAKELESDFREFSTLLPFQ